MLWWVHLHIFEAKLEGEELSPFVIGSVGLVEFAIPWAVLRIPSQEFRTPQAKLSRIPLFRCKKLPDSGIQIPLLGEKHDKSWTQRS